MKDRVIGCCIAVAAIFASFLFYQLVLVLYHDHSDPLPTYYNKGPQDAHDTQ